MLVTRWAKGLFFKRSGVQANCSFFPFYFFLLKQFCCFLLKHQGGILSDHALRGPHLRGKGERP
jgi:hypothetical protein